MRAPRLLGMIAYPSLCVLFIADVQAQSGAVVSNVTASQRQDYSRLVDVRYNLSASVNCTVWVVVSDNGGTTWSVPAQTVTGAVGRNIGPGMNKLVTWDAGADIPGKTGNFRVRVYADDGVNNSMVLIPSGSFPYQNGNPFFVPAFMIDKYEVTNQRYCEFLNAADPNGTHWDSNQEITRSGTPPSVYYAVNPGRQNYPVRYVSYDDAVAMAAWLSSRDGRIWRLPTEQEWEKSAAWDPSLQKHWTYGFLNDSIDCSWANTHSGYQCYGSVTECGHFNGIGGTNDARTFFGCYDITGNLFEMTAPANPSSFVRGGAYAGYCCSPCSTSNRGCAVAPAERGIYWGFRLALELP